MVTRHICLYFPGPWGNRQYCQTVAAELKNQLQENFDKEYNIDVTKHVDLNGNETGFFNIMIDIENDVAFYYAYGYLSVYGGVSYESTT